MNTEYTDIFRTAQKIKPLLVLLEDGLYLLADTVGYPSDGEGHFFFSVPDKLTEFQAMRNTYYSSDYLKATDSFPLFLYPTESSRLIDENRVEEYVKLFKESKNPPRVLAYYEAGFFSVLLDGHHKACAAAKLETYLHCITIIPNSGIAPNSGSILKSLWFSSMKVLAGKELTNIYLSTSKKNKKHDLLTPLPEFSLNDRKIN